MLGQPDPIVPVTSSESTEHAKWQCRRDSFVSIWAGSFGTIRVAETYFGIPDEIGVYLPPDGFAADLGIADFPPDNLEVNFEQLSPRPLNELLRDTTFAATFVDPAMETASRLGIREVQGAALLYDVDFRRKPATVGESFGPMRFIGSFPFVSISPEANLQPFRDICSATGLSLGAVLFVQVTIEEICNKRQQETDGESGHVTARDLCDHLLGRCGSDTAAILREFGLNRSEDIGRIVFEMADGGVVIRRESDLQSDFDGLFDLGASLQADDS